MKKPSIALVIGLLAVAPCAAQDAPPRQSSIDLPPALARVLTDYEREWAEGDATALSALFTEDGFAGSRSGWVRGRDAIRAEYQRAGGKLQLRAHAWAMDGDAGYIVGSYGYGATAGQVDSGRFVLALRRSADGRWLIAADLDATNRQ
jgi:uncharacterized protein (TIGR02246 family)